ncbi:MAG: hypothetical protein IID31_05430 [Planctomycetes bacterium]|nr:hypothetical protein [Planctomycetota bacterium]
MRKTLVTVGVLCCSAAWAQVERESFERKILIRMDGDPAGLRLPADIDLDPFGRSADGLGLDFRVTARELSWLQLAGHAVEVLDADIYATWERVSGQPGFGGDGPWGQYHDLASAYQFLDDLNLAHPVTTALFEVGRTIEGRSIRGIRISSDAATIDRSRPAIFVTGCHHAREWIAVEAPLYIAEQLAAGYGVDPAVTALLDRAEVWIVPIVNPDGLVYTQIDRFWRKNRRDNGNGTWGVDLNRNYSYKWGFPGASASPSSNTYRGTAPFSEPETRAIRDAFAVRDFAVGLTYHNYGQLVMSPWGYTTAPPPGSARMEGLAFDMAQAINAQHSSSRYDYTSGRWGAALYIGSGIFVDWVFGELDRPAFIVEMRGPFTLQAVYILPTVVENFAGFMHMAREIAFSWCYADCDRTTGTGVLDIFDFLCFQNSFVAGDPDGYACACASSGTPVCDIFDFLCFQNAFVGGCR